MKRRSSGFTLIELLIALAITAIIGVLTYRGLSSLLSAQQRLHDAAQAWQAVHRFVAALEADWRNALPRAGRDAAGVVAPALVGLPVAERPFGAHMALQRLVREPDRDAGVVQRLGYRLADGEIRRVIWSAPDLAAIGDPVEQLMLQGVAGLTIRYKSADGPWSAQWPPAGAAAGQTETLPDGLEVTLTMREPVYGGPLTWVFSR
jgi:general secretion pathway protein J